MVTLMIYTYIYIDMPMVFFLYKMTATFAFCSFVVVLVFLRALFYNKKNNPLSFSSFLCDF